jgi:hypothetical protein
VELTEVQLNWTIAVRNGDVDIALDRGTTTAAVIYPWFKEPADLRPVMDVVKGMGYVDIVETGNLPGYKMSGVDTIDFDYILVRAK